MLKRLLYPPLLAGHRYPRAYHLAVVAIRVVVFVGLALALLLAFLLLGEQRPPRPAPAPALRRPAAPDSLAPEVFHSPNLHWQHDNYSNE